MTIAIAAPAPLARVTGARPGPAPVNRADRASDLAAAAPTPLPAIPEPAGNPGESGFALALAAQPGTPALTPRAPGALPPTAPDIAPAAFAPPALPGNTLRPAMPGKTLPPARPDTADPLPARNSATGTTPARAARDKQAKATDRNAAGTTPDTTIAADAPAMQQLPAIPVVFAPLPIPRLPDSQDQPASAGAPRLQPGASAMPINPAPPITVAAQTAPPGAAPDPASATLPGTTRAAGRRSVALFAPAAATTVRSGNLPEQPATRPGAHPGATAAQATATVHHAATDADPERPRETARRQAASPAATIMPATPAMTTSAPAAAATADAAPAPVPGPTDFATLVDQIARARAEHHDLSTPAPVGVTMHHADFGRVSLHFSPRDQGLTVTLHSPDPGFAPAAAAAASGNDGGTLRDDRSAPDQPQPGAAPPDAQAQGRTANDSGRTPDRRNGTPPDGHPARAGRASTNAGTGAAQADGIFA